MILTINIGENPRLTAIIDSQIVLGPAALPSHLPTSLMHNGGCRSALWLAPASGHGTIGAPWLHHHGTQPVSLWFRSSWRAETVNGQNQDFTLPQQVELHFSNNLGIKSTSCWKKSASKLKILLLLLQLSSIPLRLMHRVRSYRGQITGAAG